MSWSDCSLHHHCAYNRVRGVYTLACHSMRFMYKYMVCIVHWHACIACRCINLIKQPIIDYYSDGNLPCFNSTCSPLGDLRLVNGSLPTEGRVEVCLHSQWSTVCSNGWHRENADVVCRQSGYENSENIYYSRLIHSNYCHLYMYMAGCGHYFRYSDTGTVPIVLNNVDCIGSELRLFDCQYTSVSSVFCRHLVAVRCGKWHKLAWCMC